MVVSFTGFSTPTGTVEDDITHYPKHEELLGLVVPGGHFKVAPPLMYAYISSLGKY